MSPLGTVLIFHPQEENLTWAQKVIIVPSGLTFFSLFNSSSNNVVSTVFFQPHKHAQK